MSTILKKAGKPAESRAEAPGNQGAVQTQKVGGKDPQKNLRPPLTTPEIPGTMKKLLDDKDRTVKGLKGIQVTFFPKGLFDTLYIVERENADGTMKEEELTVTQFMKLTEQTLQERRAEHEMQGYEGLALKYQKRLLITLVPEVTREEGRRVVATKMPPTAKQLVTLSQKEFLERFPNQESIVEFWEKSPEPTMKAMNELQTVLNPKGNWSTNLVAARREIADQKAARAARDLERLKRRTDMVKESVPDSSLHSEEEKTSRGDRNPVKEATRGVDWNLLEEQKEVEDRRNAVWTKYQNMADGARSKVSPILLADPESYRTQENTNTLLAAMEKAEKGE